MTARFSVKNRHIENDLILMFKNSHVNSQGYYCQTKIHASFIVRERHLFPVNDLGVECTSARKVAVFMTSPHPTTAMTVTVVFQPDTEALPQKASH